jgi:glycerophosphoryl diester phosphodiesterase
MKPKTDRRPLVFGHRGASAVAPMNTLAAFKKAIELGADGVELDVQYTSDGKLVVIHDQTLEHSSDGTGRVVSHTLEEIQQFDAGSWFDPQFKGERIPTLGEVFDTIGDRILVNIELKSLTIPLSDGMDRDIVAFIRERNLFDQVIVSSFNPFALRRVKKKEPRIEIGLLYAPDMPTIYSHAQLRPWIKPDALHPENIMVNEHYMEWARHKGYPVNVWTANDEDEMRRLIELGVNMIMTDYPDKLLSIRP